MNKKFDRLKQWSKERMGGEVKTDTSDDFKALEVEMQLRNEGMDKLKRSADVYVKHISKRDKYEDKDQQLPIGYFGSAMIGHGDDFEPNSEFGQCLTMLGRANERIARMQETYSANATSCWLESLERSLLQMKEYQAARKKLESRRLAYDTASIKVQKLKKEDYRMEEELRSQKMKYEESNEDVYRRMLDIKDAELDSVADLTSFLDAELAYHDRCRDVLLQLRQAWPATTTSSSHTPTTSSPSASTTTLATTTASSASTLHPRARNVSTPSHPPTRPHVPRSFSGSSVTTSSAAAAAITSRLHTQLHPTRHHKPKPRSSHTHHNGDGSDTESTASSTASDDEHIHNSRQRPNGYRLTSGSRDYPPALPRTVSGGGLAGKKAPPPPPPPVPSRAKKPPPLPAGMGVRRSLTGGP